MGERLAGRVALVTGAGNGIGRSVALALAAEGAQLVANDLGTDELGSGSTSSSADATVADIESAGGSAVASYDSVADFDGAGRAVARAVDSYGRIDITVNCAGAALGGSIFDMEVDDYHKVIALQMSQKWYIARHAVPLMVEQGWGRVVNTTSHGAMGDLGQPAFAASMGGVISLTKALATETAGTGVTANCLAPGAATRLHAMTRDEFASWHEQGIIDDAMWESYLTTPPPEYVAPAVAWLCTEAAAHVSGEVVHAAGGQISVWSPYREERTIYRGDHREVPPWTLDELDTLMPRNLVPPT